MSPILVLCAGAALAQSQGLHVSSDGNLVRDGQAFRGIGVNYFDAFHRTLERADDTSYDSGFRALAAARIPFARFIACGFWPTNARLYLDDPGEYFRRLDGVVRSAERHGIGLIPSLFWHPPTVSDLVGESCDQWGNPESKTLAYMRQYVRDVVTRYRGSPAIWGWEFGNEFNLGANLPNAAEHRPAVWPTLGTAESRSERDEWSYEIIRVAFAEFGREVRKYDTYRMIATGDSLPRTCAWNNWQRGTWDADTPEQWAEMLLGDTPAPVDVISGHAYADDVAQIAVAADIARRAGKPLFIGEFGAPGPPAESGPAFRRLLRAIEQAKVPLAALWVYDFGHQDDYSVTASNGRAYQLKAISAANWRLGQEGTMGR